MANISEDNNHENTTQYSSNEQQSTVFDCKQFFTGKYTEAVRRIPD